MTTLSHPPTKNYREELISTFCNLPIGTACLLFDSCSPLQAIFPPGWISPSPWLPFTGQVLQPLDNFVTSARPAAIYWCVSWTRGPETGYSIDVCSNKCWLEEDNHLLPYPVSAVQEAVVHHYCQVILLASVSLTVLCPPGPSCRAAPRPGNLWPMSMWELLLSQV